MLLKKVDILNLWGNKNIHIDFNKDVNFIIGINGSGKTTVVNLIVSSLLFELDELIKIDFDEIRLKLFDQTTRRQPILKLRKIEDKLHISYRSSSKEKEKDHVIDLEELNRFGHLPISSVRKNARNKYFYKNLFNFDVNLSWLSVQRTKLDLRELTDKFHSNVDYKLYALSNDLIRYFSFISKQVADAIEDFQKIVFLSLLLKKDSNLKTGFRKLEAEKERHALENIFQQFKVTRKDDLTVKLDYHFKTLEKAQYKLNTNDNLTYMDVSVLVGTERIDYIVDEWNNHLLQKRNIEEPRENFLKIINSMMQRKIFSINSHNELVVKTQSGKDLSLQELSSGEKQLLIILGEALLQENKHFIYFADEPELSLHVKWQECLVEHLRSINPNAQIIFATHSPDVVSIFDEKVFDMEKIIK